MTLFAESVKDLDTDAIAKAATAAGMIVELSKEGPHEGGLLSDIIGDTDLKSLCENLQA